MGKGEYSMTVLQTAYPPLPHKHNGSDLIGYDTTTFYASAVLNSAVNAPYNTDTYATSGWTAESDRWNIIKRPGDVPSDPGNDAYTRIVVPRTGFYEVNFNTVINVNAGQRTAAKITLNGGVTTNSIASVAKYNDAGVEQNLNCKAVYRLPVNQLVYWSWWTDQNTNPPAQLMTGHYGGVKTRMTIEWIGE